MGTISATKKQEIYFNVFWDDNGDNDNNNGPISVGRTMATVGAEKNLEEDPESQSS